MITARDWAAACAAAVAARTPITAEIIGARLRQLLRASGLTQQQLAEAASTTQPAVNDYLHGRVMPTLPILERIAGRSGFDCARSWIRIKCLVSARRKIRFENRKLTTVGPTACLPRSSELRENRFDSPGDI